jgi:replicative DNA helicase
MEPTLTIDSKTSTKQAQHSSPFTRIPPQATELENTILGIMMLHRNSIDTVNGILTADCFYSDANQTIFEAINTLIRKGRTPDVVSVVDQLTSEGKIELCGGPYGVSKLTNNVTSSADTEGKCKKVQEKFILRELIRINGEIIDSAYEFGADAFDILDYNESKLLELSSSHLNSDYADLAGSMVRVVKKMEEMKNKGEDITGVPSGFTCLDKVIHGWQPTDFIVLAARPSVGKSAFALNLARNAAIDKHKPTSVGLFSLEMSLEQLVQRILSAQSGIWLERIKTGNMEEHHMRTLLTKGVMQLENAKVFIDDTAGLTIQQLRSKARRMVMKDDVGLILIDYLQLLKMGGSNKNGNREQEIASISRELKILAKELKIPIIALAQLSREIEKRASKVPVLSDIRESGSIEQDADIVGFLYRPSKEERLQDADIANKGMLSIAKHRNGALVDLAFEADDNIQKWEEVGVLGAEPANNLRRVPDDYTEPKSNNEQDYF